MDTNLNAIVEQGLLSEILNKIESFEPIFQKCILIQPFKINIKNAEQIILRHIAEVDKMVSEYQETTEEWIEFQDIEKQKKEILDKLNGTTKSMVEDYCNQQVLRFKAVEKFYYLCGILHGFDLLEMALSNQHDFDLLEMALSNQHDFEKISKIATVFSDTEDRVCIKNDFDNKYDGNDFYRKREDSRIAIESFAKTFLNSSELKFIIEDYGHEIFGLHEAINVYLYRKGFTVNLPFIRRNLLLIEIFQRGNDTVN